MFKYLTLFYLLFQNAPEVYKTTNGFVRFQSTTQSEKINAKSGALRAVIDPDSRKFAFAIKLNSFHGFNSQLQEEHYNENYVESRQFPEANFKGRIIESIDFNQSGIYNVRAKGDFYVHGVTNHITVPAEIKIKNLKEISIKCILNINLKDYGIKIPKVVHMKLAEIIQIQVNATLLKSTTQIE
ncbi:MAG: YceI family protein [Chitinophagaceae bacterium]|nr:YceI family protein [Chitinophagaceae bacterium]